MREYELIVLLHPDLEIDADAPIGKIEKQIADQEGKVIKRDNWGKKRLAYPISGNQFAVYVFFAVHINPEKVSALNRSLRLTEEVIRYLLVKQPEEKAKAPTKKRAKVIKEAEAEPEKEKVSG